MTVRVGHVIDELREMADGSAHCVVTSPPYYGLRDYGLDPVVWEPVRYAPMAGLPVMAFPGYASPERFAAGCDHDWDAWAETHDVREEAIAGKTRTTDRVYGDDASRRFNGNHQKHAHGQFCRKCGAWRGCLGLEPTPALYIGHLVQVFREVRRVLREDGTLWLNLGDSYASGNRRTRDVDRKLAACGMNNRLRDADVIKPKDLMGIPWKAAFALQADGWWLRSDIVWAKPNPMPESVTDRPTRAHEMLFLLTKSQRYFYDQESVKEATEQPYRKRSDRFGGSKYQGDSSPKHSDGTLFVGTATRNKRDVWSITTKPYSGAHFAVMPPDLVEPCIRAGTSAAGACPRCGAPWKRVVERDQPERPVSYNGYSFHRGETAKARENLSGVGQQDLRSDQILSSGWSPSCNCPEHDPVPCVALDPFGGSGTTAMVASNLGRQWEIIEANPQYAALVDGRVGMPSVKREPAKNPRSRTFYQQIEFFENIQ